MAGKESVVERFKRHWLPGAVLLFLFGLGLGWGASDKIWVQPLTHRISYLERRLDDCGCSPEKITENRTIKVRESLLSHFFILFWAGRSYPKHFVERLEKEGFSEDEVYNAFRELKKNGVLKYEEPLTPNTKIEMQ